MISSAKMRGTASARPSEYQPTPATAAVESDAQRPGHRGRGAPNPCRIFCMTGATRTRAVRAATMRGRHDGKHGDQTREHQDVRRRRLLEDGADRRGDRPWNDGAEHEYEDDEGRGACRSQPRVSARPRVTPGISGRRAQGSVTRCHSLKRTASVDSSPLSSIKALFFGSAAALAWTHIFYPAVAGARARHRPRPVHKVAGAEPSVTVVVAAHDEEAVIERRLVNLLELDYPPSGLEIVVASDASTDRTNEIVQRLRIASHACA